MDISFLCTTFVVSEFKLYSVVNIKKNKHYESN